MRALTPLALLLLLPACTGNGEFELPARAPRTTVQPVPVVDMSDSRPLPDAARAAPAPPSHPVFDLIDNRFLAHRQVNGGLWIDGGSPGLARYAHGNRPQAWSFHQTTDDRPVAHPRRSETILYVPLTERQAEEADWLEVSFWYESGRYPMDAEVNGVGLEAVSLTAGWQTAGFAIPPATLVSGENAITVSWPGDGTRTGQRARAALSGLYIGPSGGAATGDPPAPLPGPGAWAPIALRPNEGLAYYVVLPRAPSLVLQPGGVEGDTPPAECRFEVLVTDEGGASVGSGVALGGWDGGPMALPLDHAPVGEVVRLELTVGEDCPALALESAALHTGGEAPRVPEFDPPRNVVVWLVDALRADRLRSIRPDTRVIGPAFDRFAAEGVVFTRAYVQGNESFASHASLFAGRYPAATGVHSSRDHLGSDEELLAETARRAGLFAGGYSSNGHIRSTNGFEQGFSTFINTLRDNYRYLAPGLLGHASSWVDDHLDERFYLYVGTVDCHVTYRSHEDILPLYDAEPYDGPFRRSVGGDELGMIKGGGMPITDRDRVRIEAIYDDTVTFSDRHFGMFLDHLEERGILDDTLVIVTSDHGDEFWEHGSVGHGHNVYDELVHVPLLMRYPGAIPAGTVVTTGVDTIDISPTLAHLLGVEPPERAQGESLLPLIHGVGADYPRPAFSQQYSHTFAMSLHDWKVIWRRDGERRLYHIPSDPTEQHDVATDHPFALRFLTDAMGLFLPYRVQWSKAAWGVPSNLRAGFDPPE